MDSNLTGQPSEPRPWRFLAILLVFGVAFVIVGRYLAGAASSNTQELVASTQPATSTTRPAAKGFTERGRELFTELGCHACHGEDGVGGVDNLNYVLGTVPALDVMAERLMLMQPEDARKVIDMLEQGVDPASFADDPPFPDDHRFLAQYGVVTTVIKKGATAAKKDPAGPPPLFKCFRGEIVSPTRTYERS